MRHLAEVDRDRPAVDVATDSDRKRAYGLACFRREEHITDGHELALLVCDFDPDGRLARDGSENADIGGGHRISDVLVERGDLGHLHPGT